MLNFIVVLKLQLMFLPSQGQCLTKLIHGSHVWSKMKGKRKRKAKISGNFELSLYFHIKITCLKGLVGLYI